MGKLRTSAKTSEKVGKDKKATRKTSTGKVVKSIKSIQKITTVETPIKKMKSKVSTEKTTQSNGDSKWKTVSKVPKNYRGKITDSLMSKCLSSLLDKFKSDSSAPSAINGKKTVFDDAASSEWTKGRACLDILSFKIPVSNHKKNNVPLHPRINRFAVPHTLTDGSTSVLLVTKDYPKRGADVTISNGHHKDILTNAGCNHLVTEIMTLSQLKADMMEVPARRELCGRFDVVLCDSGLVKVVPRLLGRDFLNAKKHPVSVRLQAPGLKKEIERKLSQVTHKMTYRNTQSSITFGRSCQSVDELKDNLKATLDYLVAQFPGGWPNVKSLYLTMGLKTRVPLYVSKHSGSEVKVPQIKMAKPEVYEGDFGFGNVKITSDLNLLSYQPVDVNEYNIFSGLVEPVGRGNKHRQRSQTEWEAVKLNDQKLDRFRKRPKIDC